MWTFRPGTVTCISRQLSRFYCSNKNKILAARYQQKKLYGAVVKKDDYSENFVDLEDSSVTYEKYTSVNTESSSEYHWLIKNYQQSKHVKLFKSDGAGHLEEIRKKPVPKLASKSVRKPARKPVQQSSHDWETVKIFTAPNIATDLDSLSPASNQSAIVSAKNLLNEFIISTHGPKSTNNIDLLFDDKGLTSITKYSIMNDKLSEHQLNEIIFDKRLPSITKVLQATMPESARIALERWKLAKIKELGEAGFNLYQQETLEMGKQFHLAIETYLNEGQEPAQDSLVSKLWTSLGAQLKDLQPKSVLTEKQIIHPDLKYKGIIDNVSYINNELCALEWKTSEKMKSSLSSTFDAPIQLCAYIGALNVDPRYDVKLKTGYVVVAYKNGDTAHIFRLSESDIQKYWSVWLSRLQEYWMRYRDGTLPDPI